MFENLKMAQPDPNLGLNHAFREDKNPDKIKLGVGVYKDESGATPIFKTVKKAEQKILEQESSKDYLSISGFADFAAMVQGLVFGSESDLISAGRVVTAQTPGGTGALRIAGDFLKKICPDATVWVSDPTWANHIGIFSAAGFATKMYCYYNPETKDLDFEKMIQCIRTIPQGDIILLHGCCHNPTGIDPTPEQWAKIAAVAAERKLFPLIDFAYQGLGDGIDQDAAGVRIFARTMPELLVCSSFSKNFGLYNERVGALSVVGNSADAAERAFSHLKTAIRQNYSNPPAHGAKVVAAILKDPILRQEWDSEVEQIRRRIQQMRQLFVETLRKKNVKQDFSFIARQKGMFSFSGLNKVQVEALRSRYAIYIVGSGRINVAGMTTANMDRLCSAIADVLKD